MTITSHDCNPVGTTIRWNAAPNATKYRVYAASGRYADGTLKWGRIGETYATSFCDEKVGSGTVKYYTVRCLNKNNNPISPYDDYDGYCCEYQGISRDRMIRGIDIKLASGGSTVQTCSNKDCRNGTVTASSGDIAEGVSVESQSIKVLYQGQYVYVPKKYALINVNQYIPSAIVAMSYAGDTYVKGNTVPKDADTFNMFAYKTNHHVTGLSDKKYYTNNVAWLQYDVAYQLAGAQAEFMKNGYCIKLYDAYRPKYVSSATDKEWNNWLYSERIYTQALDWQIAPDSKHNYAAAVDMTLVSLPNGREVKMPTQIHDISTAPAWTSYSRNIATSDFLKIGQPTGWDYAKWMHSVLKSKGFGDFDGEWWHYDMPSYQNVKYNADV